MTQDAHRYPAPAGGLPPQTQAFRGPAVFTEGYALVPRAVQTDIVTSALPGWDGMRMWVLARPMTGFAETLFQAAVELAPGGGSEAPETEAGVQGALFVTRGALRVRVGAASHDLTPGGYAWLPPDAGWTLRSEAGATFQWIRKRYVPAPGLPVPEAFAAHEDDAAPDAMPGTDGAWTTRRFHDPADMGHDMAVNIVSLAPGASIPFLETHVMEHGLYVLEGRGAYALNRDRVEVGAGDFMWLRAFCPQACIAGGPGRFRYLLYKDVNRLPPMRL